MKMEEEDIEINQYTSKCKNNRTLVRKRIKKGKLTI